MATPSGLLLTDLYQLHMMQVYFEHGMTETAVFEFFVRKLPPRRGFLMAAGLEQALEFLEGAEFTREDLHWLKNTGQFGQPFLDYLESLRFTGDVDAMPEGTAFFADEPILRVAAPLPQAQLFETRLINIMHFQTLIASKAARMVLAAPGKTLVDFGLRRAHGAQTGLLAARAAYLAGFDGSATVLAKPVYGMPIYGTMAHSYVQAHDDETVAFERFARARRENVVLVLDTYDTEAAAEKIVTLAARLRKDGIAIDGVRLDSGDLADHARRVRPILDAGGLRDVKIFASGGLDEDLLKTYTDQGVPIDGYGVGSALVTSSDAPALDCAYKLQEYADLPRRKNSEGKSTWPGRKQVYRMLDKSGTMTGDLLTTEGDMVDGEGLIVPVMREGEIVLPVPEMKEIRARAADQLARLPKPLRLLEPFPYPVEISRSLRYLARVADQRAGLTPFHKIEDVTDDWAVESEVGMGGV